MKTPRESNKTNNLEEGFQEYINSAEKLGEREKDYKLFEEKE